jgi:hypothetical protein
MKRIAWIALLLLAAPAQVARTAEESSLNAQRAAEALSSARRDVIEAAMGLTMEQKDAFWAIYSEYEAARTPLSEQALAMVESYVTNFSTNTNEQNVKMMAGSATNQKKMIDLRAKYANKMAKTIAPEVGVRFYQVDDYLTTASRLAVLDDIPFIGRSQ